MGTNHLRSFKQINITTASSAAATAAATKNKYSLRHRAAVPAFSLVNTPSDASGDKETNFKPLPPWNLRSRNQLERTHLNHRESAIALELLQDLAIPLDQLSSTNSHEQQPSEIRDLLQHQPKFQSILSQHSSSNKSLSRHRPNKLSSEDVRVQDIQKEIIDLILHRIDSFNSDCDLLSWLDQQVLSQTRPSHPHHKSESSPLSDNNTNNPRNQLGESFLHPLASQLELDMDFEQDPEKMLEQPLCFTPLFSPILLHVMEAFSDGYKNPHLALYLFDWVRSHSDPLVKYFGLTRDVYLLVLRIKWEAFQDFGGIHKHLLEMKALGLELDERFKRLIHHITRLVLQDEIQAERRLALRQPLPPHQSPENILDTLRKITPLERYHISQIESLLNQFIQNQDDLLATKLRSPPPAPPHHT